jgi:5-methylcytosine-specific restriction enzyme B
MAASEDALRIQLTRGAIDNGYIRVPSDQQLFSSRFIAGSDGESEDRFSLVLPNGTAFRTCVLGKYNRLQLRLGAVFKELRVLPGDYAILDRDPNNPERYILIFERDQARPSASRLGVNGESYIPMPNLNRIFYGPPGTGKTYATVAAALQVLDPQFLSQNRDDRASLKGRFDELSAAGDIRFVTFHQSFSYEDFVEGLRAEADEGGQLRYEIADGIFKTLCDAATAKITEQRDAPVDLENRRIWKMSLGNSLGDDAYIFDECIQNGYALLGYGGATDFSDCKDREDVFNRFIQRNEAVTQDSYPVSAVNTFLLKVKEGDLIVVSEGNSKFRAIGQVTGAYRVIKRDEQSDSYGQCRSVKWLRVYKPSLPFEQLMNNQFSQMTLYELRPGSIDIAKLAALLDTVATGPIEPFRPGDRFGAGAGYEVVHASADLVELSKPNGSRVPLGMSIIRALAEHVRRGQLTLDDIRTSRVFDKLSNTNLEKHIVNGYNNVLPSLVERFLAVQSSPTTSKTDAKVLIIDEINRGNISRIFGELITLIEPTKRKGAAEALEVVLPYSKRRFSVPDNVYLIGTMNTADRSLTSLDLALRRRFVFEEMVPEPDELEGIEISGVNVDELLQVMNDRIEILLDREHRIGHAYFLSLRNNPTIDALGAIFRRQILPLLEEYFFEDWARIQWVFNDHRKTPECRFVVRIEDDVGGLFGDEVSLPRERVRWKVNEYAFGKVEAYLGVIDSLRQSAPHRIDSEVTQGDLTIRRLSSGTIEVWEKGAKLPEAKATLRKLAAKMGLKTSHPSGTSLNTRALGNAVITVLKSGAV